MAEIVEFCPKRSATLSSFFHRKVLEALAEHILLRLMLNTYFEIASRTNSVLFFSKMEILLATTAFVKWLTINNQLLVDY